MSRKQPSAMTPSSGESPDYVQSRQSLDGRMEKRLPIIMVVRLLPVQRVPASGEELTYTDNVSANGARVFSRTCWEPGEQVQVTAVKEKSSMRGEVIYCQRLDEDHYCVGLKYLEPPLKWFPIHRFHGK
jgi:PilZ domain